MKDWQTTVAGFCGGLAILATQVAAFLDKDPTTEYSLAQIATGLGLLGIGWFSKVKDKK